MFPTHNDIRKKNWEQDQRMNVHIPSNPQCTCELCRMNASVVGPNTLGPGAGQTSLSGFQNDMDPRELTMAQQLKTGQRAVIKMKKSQYDLEPQQFTGIVKYVGKVDSEYIDNRIYVGVKLDEAGNHIYRFMCVMCTVMLVNNDCDSSKVRNFICLTALNALQKLAIFSTQTTYHNYCVTVAGDTDGLIKGKRYFTCPPKHGKIVRISNVVAILPSKVSACMY